MKTDRFCGCGRIGGVGAAATVLVILLLGGCGGQASPEVISVTTAGPPPTMPLPVVGQALVGGYVRDAAGQAVGGAKVLVTETDASTVTDASGAYHLMIRSDSTTTMVASADGFGSTFHESVVIASQATVASNDFLLLSPDSLTAINKLAAPGAEATRGTMAVRLHSMDPSCSLAGGTVTVRPLLAAKVVYSRGADGGGLDQPDETLTSLQPGTTIGFWLSGVIPPGNGITVQVNATGCAPLAQSPDVAGLTFTGQRQVAAKTLTEADLFLGVVR